MRTGAFLTVVEICDIMAIKGDKGCSHYIVGGDSMSILETLMLIDLLASIVFGVIQITKKK